MNKNKMTTKLFLGLLGLFGCSGVLANTGDFYQSTYNFYSGHIDTSEYPAADGFPDLVLKGEHIVAIVFDDFPLIFPASNGYEDIVFCGQADGSYTECTPNAAISKNLLTKLNHNYIQGDFDGDGFSDLILQAPSGSEKTLLLLGNSNGNLYFDRQINQLNSNTISADLVALTITDVDGDGRDELLLNGANPTPVYTSAEIDLTILAPKSYSLPLASYVPENPNNNSAGVGAIAATFDVTAVGKPSYSIPILLPPHVGEAVPNLSLVYSGQDSNDFVGVGWYLNGLSTIDRCATTLEQDGFILGVNFLANDKFCLNGERLKLISGTYGVAGAEYRTENESFTKITSHGSFGSGPAYFQVWKSTGVIETYGNSTDSRRTNSDGSEAVSWAINELKDRQNNAAQFVYQADAGDGQHRIDQITLGNNSINFEFEPRTDVIVNNANGAHWKKAERLKSINTLVGANEVHSYELAYEYGIQTGRSRLASIVECAQQSFCLPATSFEWDLVEPNFEYSLAYTESDELSYPTGKDYDKQQYLVGDVNKDGRSDLVWTYRDSSTNTLGWVLYLTDGVTGQLAYASNGQETGYAVSQIEEADFSFMLGDVNGDGRQDLVLATRRNQDFYRNIYLAAADGLSFEPQGYQADTDQQYLNYEDGRYLLADVNGDGRQDLVWIFVFEGELGIATYQAVSDASGNAGFARTSLEFDTSLSPLYYLNLDFVVGDVNGDSKADITWLFSFDNAIYRTLFLANGSGTGFYKVSVQKDDFGGPTVEAVSNPAGHLGDINGDNKADLVFTYNSENAFKRRVYLSSELGTSFDKTEEVIDANLSPDSYSKTQASLADLNGDGLSDLLYTYVENTEFGWVSYIAKLDGSGFQQVSSDTTANVGAFTENQHHLTGDINADGKTDFIWAYNTSINNTLHQQAFTLPTSHPDHITKITDGLSNVTSIDYTYLSQTLYSPASDRVFDASTDSVYPVRDDVGLSYVVDHLEISNATGGSNSWDYRYSGAKTNLIGRGFLGFQSRQITDNQTGFVSQETYLQAYPYIGLVTANETHAASGEPIALNYMHWKSTDLHGGQTSYRFLADSLTTKHELDGEPLSANLVINQYDLTNGNLTSSIKSVANSASASAIGSSFNPESSFSSSDLTGIDLVVTTTNQYLHENSADWRLGFLSKQTMDYAATGEAVKQVVTEFTPQADDSFLVASQRNFVGSDVWATNNYQYDSFGNQTQIETLANNAASRVENHHFTADGLFLEYSVNSQNQTTHFAFDTFTGSLKTVTDPNSRLKTTLTDGFGRLVYVRETDGQETNRVYSQGGNAPNSAYTVTTTTNHTGESGHLPTRWQEFDALDREIRSDTEGFDGTPIRIATVYDSRGRLSSQTEPHYVGDNAPTNSFTWDDLDRIKTKNDADGGSHAHSYAAAAGFSSAETHHQTILLPTGGNKTISQTQYRNSLGQIERTLDADNTETNYLHDSQGNLNRVQLDNNPATELVITYDVAGNKRQIVDPDAGTVTMTYDGYANLLTKTHGEAGDQVNSVYGYDKLSRITSRIDTSSQGTETYTWAYDQTLNSIGQLTQLTGPNYQQTISYDLFGRNETDTVILFNNGENRTRITHYDGYSRQQAAGYMNVVAVKNNYNLQGYLSGSEDYFSAALYRSIAAMDAYGNVTSETLGNGMVTQRAYDPSNGQVETIQSGPAGALQDYSYTFDTAGNLYSRASNRGSENISEGFTYDNLHRLRTATTTGLASGNRVVNYDYDALGNITTKSDVSVTNGYQYGDNGGGVHAISQLSNSGSVSQYHYDSRGNTIVSDDRNISYTVQNNPKTIADSNNTVVDFYYSPANKVMGQTILFNGQTLETLYSHNGQYETTSTATTQHQKVYVGDYLVYKKNIDASTQLQYNYRDHIGSVDIITDQLGTPLQYLDQASANADLRVAFDPWGKRRYDDWENGDDNLDQQMVQVSAETTSHGFTDHLSLDSVGLVHMQGRVYDPTIGRFLSPDFFVQDPYSSQNYNRYSYVLNNPLSYTDPDGELIPLLIWGGIAAYRAYSVYDGVTSGVADFKTATDSNAETTDRVLSTLSLGASAIGGTVARKATGKLGSIYNKRKQAAGNNKSAPQTKEPAAQGKDKNTQRKNESGDTRADSGGQDLVGSGGSVAKYEVGAFNNLQKRSAVGDKLDIHHATQKHPAGQVIDGYDLNTAPSIAVPSREHKRIPTIKGTYRGTARDLLAKDIKDLRQHTNAPNSALQDLIQLNKKTSPGAFSK